MGRISPGPMQAGKGVRSALWGGMTTDNPDIPEGERIAKVLSRAGVASRRDAERMILDGRVTVNGRVAASPAVNVTPRDRLAVDGVPVAPPEPTRIWLYHKPAGVITTTVDEEGRETVFEGLPADMPRVMAVGRLDLTSEGLLLLTNDGEVKRRLELPSTGWLRRYRVRINGSVSEAQLERLRAGVTVEGVDYAPMEVQFDRQQGANAWLTVGLREGKNREIRRVMEYLGVTVNRLIRVSYGPFQLGEIEPGAVREVARKALREQLGLVEETAEQTLTRRARGAEPAKVRPVRTGPVMRSTKGGPRPGEGGLRPQGAALAGGRGKLAAGEAAAKPRPGKPARAGHVAERPGWSAGKAAAVAAAREEGGSAPRKPRSAGYRSHATEGGAAGGRPGKAAGAPGRSAGYKSHRAAAGPGDRESRSGGADRRGGAAAVAAETPRKPRHKAGAAGAGAPGRTAEPRAGGVETAGSRNSQAKGSVGGRSAGGAAPGARRGPAKGQAKAGAGPRAKGGGERSRPGPSRGPAKGAPKQPPRGPAGPGGRGKGGGGKGSS